MARLRFITEGRPHHETWPCSHTTRYNIADILYIADAVNGSGCGHWISLDDAQLVWSQHSRESYDRSWIFSACYSPDEIVAVALKYAEPEEEVV